MYKHMYMYLHLYLNRIENNILADNYSMNARPEIEKKKKKKY